MIENEFLIENQIRTFIFEDLGFGDITTDSIINEDSKATAAIVCKEQGIVAGLAEASKVFKLLGCTAANQLVDGKKVEPGTTILKVNGPTKSILKSERTALNLLMRMSGIATATWRAQSEARRGNPKVRVAATRKTAPGLRYFDKRAIELGGGDTHRLRLDDCVLIKNNHLFAVTSIGEAVKRIKDRVSFTKKVEVEVETIEQAVQAAEARADIVMLDNMKPKDISQTIQRLDKMGLREKILIEASGGVTEKNIRQYASTGVDIISMGSLTHSVQAIDMSMKILEIK